MASSSTSRRTRISFSSVTEDIWIEIFNYLPLASIYRFKSVSKVWLSILSNPNFLTKWFQFNNKSLPWMHYHSNNDAKPLSITHAYPDLHSEFISRHEHGFSFEFLLNEGPFEGNELFASCSSNGLVLCCSFRSCGIRYTYIVCNPLTGKWVSIPSPPRIRDGVNDDSIDAIVCENSLLSTTCCCYKVVCIPRFNTPSKKFNVDVFRSDLGVWRSVEVSCDENVVWEDSGYENVVVFDGVLYCIEGGDRMLVYNMNQINGNDGHRCSLIKLPDAEFGDYECGGCDARNLGESEGCICYARSRYCTRREQITVSVWVLHEVNWQILHKDISVDDILDEQSSHIFTVIQVLGFSPVDRNIVLLGYHHRVLALNIQTRSLEELCHPSLSGDRRFSNAGGMLVPFVLKPMPTVLPPPSWMDT